MYYYTSYPSKGDADFTYSVGGVNSLTFDDQTFNTLLVVLNNSLPDRLEDISISIEFSGSILEFQAALDKQVATPIQISDNRPQGVYNLSFSSLLSGESAAIQVLLTGHDIQIKDISIQSAQRIATVQKLDAPVLSSRWVRLLPGIAALIAQILAFVLVLYLVRRKGLAGHFLNINNTAFVLLHSGEAERAAILLEKSMERRGAGIYELSNLAAAYATLGRIEEARRFIAAANFLAHDGKKSIIILNSAIVEYFDGKKDVSSGLLGEFGQADPKMFKYYRRFSKLIAKIEGRKTDTLVS
ncbi:tetratricopeptide repeat protein [Paenirhodobacter enshiensis]|uniref:tetratricopeptide repeat protein n=1 Tax=Paenirhodobacter enshiensis TaxID=1105367 RepID=UPI00126805E9|nr:hypothetical protein [Paenirhodobacter enshiensis]